MTRWEVEELEYRDGTLEWNIWEGNKYLVTLEGKHDKRFAEQIVREHNAHDGLVEALGDLAAEVEDLESGMSNRMYAKWVRAVEALAKANIGAGDKND